MVWEEGVDVGQMKQSAHTTQTASSSERKVVDGCLHRCGAFYFDQVSARKLGWFVVGWRRTFLRPML